MLTQGLHRQIRYMCKALGYRVTALKRTAIGALPLGELVVGQYRQLSVVEVGALQQQTDPQRLLVKKLTKIDLYQATFSRMD